MLCDIHLHHDDYKRVHTKLVTFIEPFHMATMYLDKLGFPAQCPQAGLCWSEEHLRKNHQVEGRQKQDTEGGRMSCIPQPMCHVNFICRDD